MNNRMPRACKLFSFQVQLKLEGRELSFFGCPSPKNEFNPKSEYPPSTAAEVVTKSFVIVLPHSYSGPSTCSFVDSRRSPVFSSLMASLVRPSLLSQSCIAPAARQVLRRQILQTYTPSEPNAASFRAQFNASGSLTLRSHAARGVGPNMLRVASFHTSGRRSILPAGPRKCDR